MRLIDADAAEEKAWASDKIVGSSVWETSEVVEFLDDCPTVDAVEVVHGRWVLAKPRRAGRNATYKCTACGQLRSSYYNDVTQWKHCPCGARMDGDHET